MRIWKIALTILGVLLVLEAIAATTNWTPVPVVNDPLVRLPGTQPNQVTLEAPTRCMNCHAGYNTQVEPGFNWQGSMMAQAARDFLFWACFVVAAQDSIHAVGTPNATDICERCHFPQGWLEGRSDPTNASLMTGGDYDGVHCDFCHRSYNPMFESINSGAREGSDWLNYWDETNASATKSSTAAAATYAADTTESQAIKLFNGGNFFVNKAPHSATYAANGSGQFFVAANAAKRASFADATGRHPMYYSRYHKSRDFCSSCHDVSNPVLANLAHIGTPPGPGAPVLPTEKDSASSYFHVERTFSEFMLSDYGLNGGAVGVGPFAPETFKTSLPGNKIARCQDCHLRDVIGAGADKNDSVIRPTGSTEHPMSGQPLHDMTGGNMFVSYVLASTVPGSPNYDATNASLLNQGPTVLTLNLTQGLGVNPQALLAGVERARQQLLMAASLDGITFDAGSRTLSFRVQNRTGHKLISGFPEGRRMFLNVKALLNGSIAYEINPYDATAGTLKGLNSNYSPNSPPLATNEVYADELVYEMHPSSSVTGEQETFHFALATGRYKDNRIPPKGFRIAEAHTRLCEPVWHGVVDLDYYTSAEYAGGYDEVSISIPVNCDAVQVGLYYQITSREYVEFLRDEINGTRQTLPASAYIIQTDPFFAKLKAWGNTIWQLWDHNRNLPTVSPFLMTQAAVNVDTVCEPPAPELLCAVPGDDNVGLAWSNVHSGDPEVIGYNVYYDQGGKAQLIAQLGLQTSYTDANLEPGQQHCYKVTSRYTECESAYSNVLCATPAPLYSIGNAKGLADFSWVRVADAVVTAGSGLNWGALYAESAMRAAGIKLLTSASLSPGARLQFTGQIRRVDGEWQIDSMSLISATSGDPLRALGLNSRAAIADPLEQLNYVRLSPAGLLVRAWGSITHRDASAGVIYVDDGGSFADGLGAGAGLRVQLPEGLSIAAGDGYACVTGILRLEKRTLAAGGVVNGHSYPPGSTVYVPSVWARDAADIRSW